MGLPARRESTPDPYDHTDQRNQLAPHSSGETALALRSELGKLLLTGESEFAAIAKSAGVPAERLVLELVSVARRKPEIMRCTPDSIMTFMFDAAKLGLLIGRGVFPVPVKKSLGRGREELRLEAWVGYKGSKELAIGTGSIRDCWAEVHFEGDDFELERAPVPRVTRHKDGPHFGDMKKAIGVYATALFPGGSTRSVYLSREDVQRLRAKNRGDTTAASSPWVTSERDMWKAKAMLQLTKDMPQNPRSAHLAAMQARQEELPADPGDRAALPSGPEVTASATIAPSSSPATGDGSADSDPAAARSDASETRGAAETDAPEVDAERAALSLGEAQVITVKTTGGNIRMLSEFRTSGLERLLTWAREGLDTDPLSERLQRIAEGCRLVLEARARGDLTEPPKRDSNE